VFVWSETQNSCVAFHSLSHCLSGKINYCMFCFMSMSGGDDK